MLYFKKNNGQFLKKSTQNILQALIITYDYLRNYITDKLKNPPSERNASDWIGTSEYAGSGEKFPASHSTNMCHSDLISIAFVQREIKP